MRSHAYLCDASLISSTSENPKPKAKREMTEEQRLAAAERLAKGRSLKHT